MHIEEKSRESLQKPRKIIRKPPASQNTKEKKTDKKSVTSRNTKSADKRRFKPLKRDELKVKKEETKKRVMTRTKEVIKNIASTASPSNNNNNNNNENNNNHVHVGELEVVAIEAPEDIINEIFGDFEDEDQALEKKPALKKEEEEKKPSWFDKERKLSVISIPPFYSEYFERIQLIFAIFFTDKQQI